MLNPELQKDEFCPVSGFSTKECLNHVFCESYHNMRHKRKHLQSFGVELSHRLALLHLC